MSQPQNMTMAYFTLLTPFIVDAVLSILAIKQAVSLNTSTDLKQDLITEKSEIQEEGKLLPKVLASYEQQVYDMTDPVFVPEFCNDSFKSNAFNLNGNTHFAIQLLSVFISFAEFYFAVMGSVKSEIAPVLCGFIGLYSLASIYAFFGLMNVRIVNMCQSYFAATKLSALALGYIFDSLANGQQFSATFFIMTLLISFDAFLGFALISDRLEFTQYQKETKIGALSFFFDNWKSQLFKSNQTFNKNTAFILTTLQGVFAFSALFNFSGFQVSYDTTN